MKDATRAKRGILFFTFLLLAAPAGARILINEAAPEETSGGDWIEFHADGGENAAGWKVYEQNALIKTFPASGFSFSSGCYLILNFNSASADETVLTGDLNGNGAIDLYTTDSGLTGTSNVISLRTPEGLLMDALVFSDSASWTSAQQSAFNLAVTTGQWRGTVDGGPRNFSESVNVPGGVGAGNSIGRDPDSFDSDAAADWRFIKEYQTKGFRNPAAGSCRNLRNPGGTISEVAPSLPLSSGGDFVEIYAREALDVCGMKVYEGESLIKTFPSATPNAGTFGPFIVLHAATRASTENPDETDAAGDLNGNGAIDLYLDVSGSGLIGGSDNTVSLRAIDGRGLDFLSFSDSLPFFGEGPRRSYDRAASERLWIPACAGRQDCYSEGSVAWNNSAAKSISRKLDPGGSPKAEKPGSARDWEISAPTPGKSGKPPQNLSQPLESALEIRQSPFSPLGDGFHKEGLILCAGEAGSKVTVKIYDTRGRLIRTLADGKNCDGAETLPWDGRDSAGSLAPVGAYIVWMEMKYAGGDLSREKAIIVVARRL